MRLERMFNQLEAEERKKKEAKEFYERKKQFEEKQKQEGEIR